jgi:hypothetical protein
MTTPENQLTYRPIGDFFDGAQRARRDLCVGTELREAEDPTVPAMRWKDTMQGTRNATTGAA